MPTVRVLRTYLQLDAPRELRRARVAEPEARVERLAADAKAVATYRTLYREVGGPWRWGERVGWSDAQIAAQLARADVAVWRLHVGDDTLGFAELQRAPDGAVEVVYFGLVPRAMGRGLGGQFLTAVVDAAWAMDATRVWLHTCAMDAPAALPAYRARGFRVTREEMYDEVVPDDGGG